MQIQHNAVMLGEAMQMRLGKDAREKGATKRAPWKQATIHAMYA